MNNRKNSSSLEALLAKRQQPEPPSQDEQSIPLDHALEQFLWQLYCHWYRLPIKSTRRRYQAEFGPALAQALAQQSADTAEQRAAIVQFATDVASLPRVRQETDGLLEQLLHVAQSQDITASFSVEFTTAPERLEQLITTLTTSSPPQLALTQMNHRPGQEQATWATVQQQIEASRDRLSPVVQATWQAIQDELTSHNDYARALDAVATQPQLVVLALDSLVKGKVYPPLAGNAMRGGSSLPDSWPELPDFSIPDGTKTATEQNFYTDAHFPSQVQPESEHPLRIQLSVELPTQSAVVTDAPNVTLQFEQASEVVEVVILAPGFTETTGHLSRLITVYPDRNSQPAVFLLQADKELGQQELSINFYHHDRLIGSSVLPVMIGMEEVTEVQQTRSILETAPISATPPPPVDLELRIVKEQGGKCLHFLLHSAAKPRSYHWQPVGSIELTADDPAQFLEHRFQRLNQLAAQVGEADGAGLTEIEGLGEELFEQLFPPQLQHEYWTKIRGWQQAGELRSLLITSDEPWIPWELIKPYRYDELTDEEESDNFLCQIFELSRWLAGRGPAGEVQVEETRIVVPSLDLPYVEKERDYFSALGQRGVTTNGEPLQQVQEVVAFAKGGAAQIIHIATHGEFDTDQPNRSAIHLQDGELTPALLQGSNIRGLRRERPILFLNTCHGGRMNFDLCGLGGWAQKMVGEIGVSAFIGAQWEIHDRLASAFAIHFYDGLQAGLTLGQAFHQARQHIRELAPNNPTWLAYTLYGDPNARVYF